MKCRKNRTGIPIVCHCAIAEPEPRSSVREPRRNLQQRVNVGFCVLEVNGRTDAAHTRDPAQGNIHARRGETLQQLGIRPRSGRRAKAYNARALVLTQAAARRFRQYPEAELTQSIYQPLAKLQNARPNLGWSFPQELAGRLRKGRRAYPVGKSSRP